ncbi:MAG: pantetheine-phosphate adenylyltransferase [Myxococcota bacterium]|nr:pantetheine-phosphate adenylyltransferase [Myxococcota bacterium]
MSAQRTAVYAGSFDPITSGHLDIAIRGSKLVDRLIIAIGVNPKKRYTFTLEERIEIVQAATRSYPNIEVRSFNGLLVHCCEEVSAGIILRGLRAVTDFEFEFQIGLANMDLAPNIETIFLLAEPQNIFISSSLVKEIAFNHGKFNQYLPDKAYNMLLKKVNDVQ